MNNIAEAMEKAEYEARERAEYEAKERAEYEAKERAEYEAMVSTKTTKRWKQIRAEILGRAGQRCEQCGVPDLAYRISGGDAWTLNAEQAEAWAMDGERVSRIVLTVAHLDHQPENCDSSNLRALCQRCRFAHDIDHRQRSAGKAAGDLIFDA